MYLIANGLQNRFQLTGWQEVAMALLPIPAFMFFLIFVIMQVRRLDELNRRVHLEALAIAFPLSMLLLMTLGLLQKSAVLLSENWAYGKVWVYLPFFYLIGLTLAWRHYR